LKNMGIEITAIDTDLSQPSAHTKYATKIKCDDLVDDNKFISALVNIAKQFKEKPVLFLTNDKYVLSVSRNRALLSQHYMFNLPEEEVIETLTDKAKFSLFAQEHNLPIPLTYIINNAEEASPIAAILQYPCVIKPIYKTSCWTSYYKANKAFKVYSEYELLKKVHETYLVMNIPVIIQEWIEGDESEIYFTLLYYDLEANLRSSFTGRKLLQWLPEVGNTCIAESVNNEKILEESRVLFDKIKFRGFASLEYKKDVITNTFKIIEPTVGRINLQSSIAMGQNINMPLQYYCDLAKIEYPQCQINKQQIFWIREQSLVCLAREPKRLMKLPMKIWIKILLGKKVFTLFSFRDPLPFIYFLRETVVAVLKTLFYSKRHHLSTPVS